MFGLVKGNHRLTGMFAAQRVWMHKYEEGALLLALGAPRADSPSVVMEGDYPDGFTLERGDGVVESDARGTLWARDQPAPIWVCWPCMLPQVEQRAASSLALAGAQLRAWWGLGWAF